jgi:hypothetical protein
MQVVTCLHSRFHQCVSEEKLGQDRDEALKRGSVDRDWFQQTVRWVTEWVPDTEITLIAALGRIARAVSPTPD